MRLFISSTCYDLIDLRAELQKFFQEAGVTVLLSDSLTSEFQVLPDRNSIETCLVNVRSCDEFLIILSNRYGPSLAPAGFPDVSATHLEYREAVTAGKPIRMFVRDRLEGDFSTWRQNLKKNDLCLPWCKHEDWRLFEILETHRKLSETNSHCNWLWIFRNSTEIKQRLAMEFKESFARTAVERMSENGRVPVLELFPVYHGHNQQSIQFELRIRNLSSAVAVSPVVELQPPSTNRYMLRSIASHAELAVPIINWEMHPGTNFELASRLTYSTLEGHKFLDEGLVRIEDYPEQQIPRISYRLIRRCYDGVYPESLLTFPPQPARSDSR